MTSPPIGSRPEGSGLSKEFDGLPGPVTSDQCGSRDDATLVAAAPLTPSGMPESEARLRRALHQARTVLTVPAAEYVPAIVDAWIIIDRALAEGQAA